MSRPISSRVLVTGASGFIGGQLREALLACGADVVSLVRPSSPKVTKGRAAAAAYEDVSALTEIMKREQPSYVFHVAGATKGVSYQDFHSGNVMPTENLLRAAREGNPGLKRFVHISSATALGPSNDGSPRHDASPCEPIEHYGRSKLAAERAVEAAGNSIPWTIIRPTVVYGPGEVDMFTLFKAAESRVNLYFGNRKKRASCVYVDDLLEAMVTAAQVERTIGKSYLICDDEPYTWQQIQSEIVRAVGKRTLELNVPGFFVPLAGRFGEVLTALDGKPRLLNRQKALLDAQEAWAFSNEAARRDFGFASRVPLREGMTRTARWYREHGWL